MYIVAIKILFKRAESWAFQDKSHPPIARAAPLLRLRSVQVAIRTEAIAQGGYAQGLARQTMSVSCLTASLRAGGKIQTQIQDQVQFLLFEVELEFALELLLAFERSLLHRHPQPFRMARKLRCIHALDRRDAIGEVTFVADT